MSKTAEPFRKALEEEINRWNGFAVALRKDDLEVFLEMMDMCRSNSSAAGNATSPILFETLIMSILVGQQKQIIALEKSLARKVQKVP